MIHAVRTFKSEKNLVLHEQQIVSIALSQSTLFVIFDSTAPRCFLPGITPKNVSCSNTLS